MSWQGRIHKVWEWARYMTADQAARVGLFQAEMLEEAAAKIRQVVAERSLQSATTKMADWNESILGSRISVDFMEVDKATIEKIPPPQYVRRDGSMMGLPSIKISERFAREFYTRHDHRYTGILIYQWLKEQEAKDAAK